ncbi:DUF86 domain-containing protein [Candidatus Binatia bacterium]|nr:DUF86 domain-containing protein [Candidatus Binatia bacterium]
MIDRERVLAKLDEMRGYLAELRAIAPSTIEEYRRTATRRACERLIQICVECVIDVCQLLVSGLRLGLPAEEADLLDKLDSASIFSPGTVDLLRRMRGCRNILVHEYGRVSDEIVFETVRSHLGDFDRFAGEVIDTLP